MYTPVLNSQQRLIKRIFDIIVASIILIAFSVVLAFVAIFIKLDSPGPILFKQKRVGENGQPFMIFKFRTMVTNAEALQHAVNVVDGNGNVLHKHRHDPRVTRIGRFLRRTSLDELPQLINVILGDMSLVGPRPELPWLVDGYEKWQYERLSVPQGITGWWQVNGRSDNPCHLNTDQDIYYVRNYCFTMDIKILIRTLVVLIRGDGAF